MNEDLYAKARELIKARKFNEARHVLLPIADEPKAKAWLDKIDEVSPPVAKSIDKPFYAPPTAKVKQVKPVRESRLGIGILLGLLSGALGGMGAGFLAFGGEEPGTEKIVIVTATPLPATLTPVATDTPSATLTPTQEPIPTEEACNVGDWWYDEVEPLLAEFFDTAELAASTARGDLTALVLEMQRIKRNYDAIGFPPCAEEIYYEVWGAIAEAVDGFVEFIGTDEFSSGVKFSVANIFFNNAWYMLLDNGVVGETRMSGAFLIWGGDAPDGTSTPTPPPTLTFTPTNTPPPIDTADKQCADDLLAWWIDASPLAVKFLDGATQAFNFGEDGIKDGLTNMDEIYANIQGVDHQGCAILAQTYLEEGISQAIEGFHVYLNLGRGTAKFAFNRANEQFYLLYALLNSVQPDSPQVDRRLESTSTIWGGKSAATSTPNP